MADFTRTDTILDKILAQKVVEIGKRANIVSFRSMREQAEHVSQPTRDFTAALHHAHVALIAEVKKASPSKGILIAEFDPVAIAMTYADHGASAISVLTDEHFFMGHLDYLRAIQQAVTVPLLRKDFVVSPYQVYEARLYGADAVLLIVAALENAQLRDLRLLIESFGMTALVEVHNEDEAERALATGATLIGVNNRDLHTFRVSLDITAQLAPLMPVGVTLVAESGITNPDDIARMAACGAHAVLVGESLITAGTMPDSVRAFSTVKRRHG